MPVTSMLIDCDVRHAMGRQATLAKYLPDAWRAYVETNNAEGMMPMAVAAPYLAPYRSAESLERAPGSVNGDLARTSIFEQHHVERAVLTHSDLRRINGLRSPFYAAEIARAANRWTADEWLEADSRLFGSILVATHLPEAAAAEIRRAAQHPRMVQVVLTGSALNVAYGHPAYEPIFAAANELGLAVAVCGGSAGGLTPPAASGGTLSYWAEYRVLESQTLMTHLVSILTTGTLERYPDVNLVLLGGGIGWIPAVLWRLDVDYRGCRAEIPWLKELPSQTFAKRVHVATDPRYTAPDRASLSQLLTCFDNPDRLMVYAAGDDHGDRATPEDLQQVLDGDALEQVCRGNARDVYRWNDIN